MQITKNIRIWYAVVFLCCFLFQGVFVNAQTTEQPYLSQNGLSITPFVIEDTMEKGQTLEHEITISNIGATDIPLSLSINDFVPVDKEGHVRFLSETEQADDKFALSHWIKITEQPEFLLKPFGQTKVKFRITPPVNAEPGTHYGGLLFGYDPKDAPVSGSLVRQKLGALVIITLGKAKEEGKIAAFEVNQDWRKQTILEFSTIFKNTGRSRVVPKGEIEIRNWYGKVIAHDYINRDGGLVLPQTERNFVTKIQKPFLFGYYTAESFVQFGNPKQEQRAHISFWVFPKKPLASLGTGLLIVVIAGYFGLKRYKKYILKNAGFGSGQK